MGFLTDIIPAALSAIGGIAGSQGSTSKQTAYPNKQTRPYIKQGLYEHWQNYQAPPQPYPGMTVAGPSPIQNQAFQNAQGVYDLGMANVMDAMGNVGRAANFMTNPDILSPDSNPYLKQYGDLMGQQISQQLNEQIMPGLRSEAVNTGAYGGTRQGIAEGLASGRASEAYQRGLADLYNRSYGSGLHALGVGGNLASIQANMSGMPQNLNAGLHDMGGSMRSILQQMMTGDQNAWNQRQNIGVDALGRFTEGVNALSNGQMTQKTYNPGDWAGGAAAGLTIGEAIQKNWPTIPPTATPQPWQGGYGYNGGW